MINLSYANPLRSNTIQIIIILKRSVRRNEILFYLEANTYENANLNQLNYNLF